MEATLSFRHRQPLIIKCFTTPFIQKWVLLIVVGSFLLVGCDKQSTSGALKPAESSDQSDIQAIRDGLENYVLSVNNADSAAGSHLFMQNGEVSFIHPRGMDTSWIQISSDIYLFFKEKFEKRNLKFFNEKITVYDRKTAWVEFNWIFNATLKGDTASIQTKGRETQIWRKDDTKWHIVHVHYSAMP